MSKPGLRPELVRLVRVQLAAGLNPMQAAQPNGVSMTYVCDVRLKMGGVYRPS